MIDGQRIAQLRGIRKMTQQQLVDRIPGLRQSRLSRIEKNLAQPNEELLALLAVELGVLADFFSRNALPTLAAHSPQFRARSRLTASSRASALQWAQLSYEALSELRTFGSSIPVCLPKMNGATPAGAAREIRKILGLNTTQPVPYLLLALERLGVTVLAVPYDDNALDAFSAWQGTEPVICLLGGRPGDRIRYSVAHELGHLVLHDEASVAAKSLSRGKDLEDEADAFAAELLTPSGVIARAMPSRPTLSSLAMLKTQWGVSIKSLIRRARELEVIDQDRAISLYKQISSRGWNRFEPGHVPVEKPRAFRKLAEIAYGDPINVGLFAKQRAWSEELAYGVLDQYARASDLPFDGTYHGSLIDFRENVIQLPVRRPKQR